MRERQPDLCRWTQVSLEFRESWSDCLAGGVAGVKTRATWLEPEGTLEPSLIAAVEETKEGSW